MRQIWQRLATAMPSLIGVVIVTFLLTRALPGDPAAYFAGPAATPRRSRRSAVSSASTSRCPSSSSTIGDLVRGDLGTSLTTGQPVLAEITDPAAGLGRTDAGRAALSMLIAVPLGVLAATRPGSWIDHACRMVSTAGVSLPVFFTGLLLVYVFYYLLGWAPAPLGRLDIFYPAAAARHRLLSDRQPDRRRLETFRAARRSWCCRR
jgi:ABC-type dipeptide/oligopeptide/nickel transport system permease component